MSIAHWIGIIIAAGVLLLLVANTRKPRESRESQRQRCWRDERREALLRALAMLGSDSSQVCCNLQFYRIDRALSGEKAIHRWFGGLGYKAAILPHTNCIIEWGMVDGVEQIVDRFTFDPNRIPGVMQFLEQCRMGNLPQYMMGRSTVSA